MPKKKSILFLVPYPLHKAPSQRFRVELFLPTLHQHGIPFRVESFLDANTWAILYSNASALKKAWGVLKGFLKRLYVVLFVVPRYQYIFIHREASPIGPPFFEFIISKIWQKKMIYDFDDAIWIANTTAENKLVSWVKAFWKVSYICRWSYKVVGGNDYLCRYARQFNSNVVLIPTCIDAVNQHNALKSQDTDRIVVGWTGSHSTMRFLDDIISVLEKIAARYDVDFLIISNKPPQFTLPRLHYLPWQEATEVEDLSKINIGIMPLEMDPWCEGKCGFKLIQYLALGIPAVASPVGVNKNIIEEGINGFLCDSDEAWFKAISTLIENNTLRSQMGEKGRSKIVQRYSVQANAGAFVDLFA